MWQSVLCALYVYIYEYFTHTHETSKRLLFSLVTNKNISSQGVPVTFQKSDKSSQELILSPVGGGWQSINSMRCSWGRTRGTENEGKERVFLTAPKDFCYGQGREISKEASTVCLGTCLVVCIKNAWRTWMLGTLFPSQLPRTIRYVFIVGSFSTSRQCLHPGSSHQHRPARVWPAPWNPTSVDDLPMLFHLNSLPPSPWRACKSMTRVLPYRPDCPSLPLLPSILSRHHTWGLQHWDSQVPVRWGSALVRTQPPPGFMLLFAFSIILGLTILFILYYVFICLKQCHDASDQSFSKYVSPKVYVMKWEFCTEQQWLWEWKGHWLASNASFLQYFDFWRSLWGCNFLPFPGLYVLCLWAFHEAPEGLAQLLRLCGVA